MRYSKTIVYSFILSVLMPLMTVAQTDPDTGTVAEAIHSGSYSYLRLQNPDRWIATSPLQVSEGDRVEYTGGMEMRDFHSKALNRTFDSIWFIQNVSVAGRDLEQLHQGVAEDHGSTPPPIPKPVGVAAPAAGEIEKLDGGRTIAEIHADPAALENQAVSLRARVIKVSPNIMGKNWVTLQDGTGSDSENSLLATSTELAAPGDTVVASGTLRNDIDIGSGYQYKVLLEEATFTK